MNLYVVARPVVVTRVSVYGSGKPTFRWEPVLYYGKHTNVVDAKRAYISRLWPNLADTSDDFIRRFWDGEPRQSHMMKIVRLTDTACLV